MAESSMERSLEIIDMQVDKFIKRIKKIFTKDAYYCESLHHECTDFTLLNPQSEDFLEHKAAATWLSQAIRESLVNPTLIALINAHGQRRARDASEMARNKYELVRADNEAYEQSDYFQITITNSIRPIAVKYTEELLYNKKFRRFCLLFKKIYIINWNEEQHTVTSQGRDQDRFMKKVEWITLKDFFSLYISDAEYNEFIEKARAAIQEARKVIGLESIHTTSPSYIHEFKNNIKREFENVALEKCVYHFIGNHGVIFNRYFNESQTDSNGETDIDIINTNMLQKGGYRILLGRSGFAKCFVTSEYLYSIFKNGNHSVEYTAVVCGYMKSIEQILYTVTKYLLSTGLYNDASIKAKESGIKYLESRLKTEIYQKRDNGMDKCHVPFQATYENVFDITLVPLICLLDQINEIWSISETGKKQIIRWLKNYADNCRNEHFHKDNILDFSEVEIIRDNTRLLLLLLLGGLKLPDGLNALDSYDDTYDRLVEILQKRKPARILFLQYGDEIIKVHRHYYEPTPELDTDGSADNVTITLAKVENMHEVFTNQNDEEYLKWFDSKEHVIISKDHMPDKIWYEKGFDTDERILIWPEESN